jgi:hypothetical protein
MKKAGLEDDPAEILSSFLVHIEEARIMTKEISVMKATQVSAGSRIAE